MYYIKNRISIFLVLSSSLDALTASCGDIERLGASFSGVGLCHASVHFCAPRTGA